MFILVTGGAGFIGSHIVDRLIELGHRVRVLDNLSTGYMRNIQQHHDDANFEFVQGDIADYNTCVAACRDIDAICHQAALGSVPRSVDDPRASHINNVDGMFNMLVAARDSGIRRFVYASSSAVYGDNTSLPKCEINIGKALSPYAVTKHVNELYGGVFNKVYNMETIGLRYFNVFGPRQNPNGPYAAVIPVFISSLQQNKAPTINGDGTYSRDFTYVANVVAANVNALLNDNANMFGNVYNVGCGGCVTINDIYYTIRDIMKSDIDPIYGPVRVGDVPHSLASIDKAVADMHYGIVCDFHNGMAKTVEYFGNNNI